MKAAVLIKPGELTVTDMPEPDCPREGVLVCVKACGICSADARMIRKGHRALTYPRIPGHEITGTVAESRHRDFMAGDAVQIAPGLSCGGCRSCRAGADHRCDNIQILGFTRDGGFAEYVAVPLAGALAGTVTPVPRGLGTAVACLAEPLACCINAQDKIRIGAGDTVCILGAGPLGLMHGLLALSRRAETVILCDPRPERLQRALAAGIPNVHAPSSTEDLQEFLPDTNRGRGLDVLIVAGPDIPLEDRLLELMAPGGRISVFSGCTPPLALRPWDANRIHYRELLISGAYGCSAEHNRKALRFLAHSRFDWSTLITHRSTLTNIHGALDHLMMADACKAIVEVNP
ncbi:MAG: alcohol dehydrogenase catalytic domain-containing protein [Thermodesulfobacteriota bacterium]